MKNTKKVSVKEESKISKIAENEKTNSKRKSNVKSEQLVVDTAEGKANFSSAYVR